MLTPQEREGIVRAAYLMAAMVVGGFVAIYPSIIGSAPLDRDALARAFIGGGIGVVLRRYGEARGDAIRAALGDVRPQDVGYAEAMAAQTATPAPAIAAPSTVVVPPPASAGAAPSYTVVPPAVATTPPVFVTPTPPPPPPVYGLQGAQQVSPPGTATRESTPQ